ncbi:NAD-dependent DNA ligase LigA [Metamycoplasma neophronis]|uniref:DNA ligase n=1 Tax=Metamycoplasma neophronis TaxID=872983 RepID=A0ABY2Z0Z8_9BACT|nr:NAD-dependent DNA ligase LigA [Metamycoplasma neophronis]TPR54073.1 NAD-dependent DNA ligase LigA [Metamycoplasma neophronis]
MAEKDEIRKKVFELQKQINEWDHAYYDLDSPIVSDSVYDTEFNKLKKLEEQYASYFSYEEIKQSPTQRINASSLDIFSKVKHDKPMLSLNKAYSIEEIQKFINNIKKVAINFSFFVEPKIDGLSISVKYHDGKLIQAVTRGDGLVGEDVTENIRQIKSIPQVINYQKDLEVRGEVYLSIEDFEKLNEILEKENKAKLANPRNAAAGTLRQLNPAIVKERNLSAFLYYVVDAEEHNIHSMEEEFNFLNNLGFQVTKESKHLYTIDEIQEYIKNFKNEKQLLNYETDGIVIKLNEIQYYDKLGSTAKFPHSAIAFKYEPDTAITTLKNIFITVGRTGLVTYNALLEPVELSGSTVSFATLNNFKYIDDLNLNINDLIYVKKAGEIIPCVIGLASLKHKNPARFEKITTCPYCQSKLIDSDSSLEQFCPNEQCPEVKRRKLIHFVSKDAMDIVTLGEKNIELLLENGLINQITDIYKLKEYCSQLMQLERMGNKSVLKMLDAIEASRNQSLDRIIYALSIKLIGSKVAKLIASKVKEFSNFLSFDYLSLTQYHEIGEKIATSVHEWVNKEENIKLVNDLLALGLNLKYHEEKENDILNNQSFVITGTLSKSRSYFEELIVKNGGIVLSSVSSKTNFLLAGEDAGSKLSKANKLNIKILNEREFLEMLNN